MLTIHTDGQISRGRMYSYVRKEFSRAFMEMFLCNCILAATNKNKIYPNSFLIIVYEKIFIHFTTWQHHKGKLERFYPKASILSLKSSHEISACVWSWHWEALKSTNFSIFTYSTLFTVKLSIYTNICRCGAAHLSMRHLSSPSPSVPRFVTLVA